jgi:branched-chain amino acid transport system permease protein
MSTFELLLQQIINGLSLGAIYALIALGYTMVYGIIELINFAHGDVFMVGSFVALLIVSAFGVTGSMAAGPAVAGIMLVVLLGSMLATGLLGVVIERAAYRRLRHAPRLAPLITAIGVSFILQNLVQLRAGPSPVRFPDIMPNPIIEVGNVILSAKQLMIIFVSVVMMVGLQWFVLKTRMGRAMRATAQDRQAASLMGIDINTTIALTFFIGSALAGAGGFVFGIYYNSVWFINGYIAGLRAFTAAVLGGIGNIAGAMFGGILIGLLESLSAQYVSERYVDAIVFAILILVLVFRPSGLLGQQLPETA